MLKKDKNIGLLVLRITVGGLMIMHGISKLINGHNFVAGKLAEKGLPEFIAFGVHIGEVLAPLGLIVGLFTRVSSLIIAFTMLMSIYLVFGTNAFTLTKFGAFKAELNLFFMFSCIAIYFLGSGKYALSEVVFKSNSKYKNL